VPTAETLETTVRASPGLPTHWCELVTASVAAAVGDVPILLLGSRAVGSASPLSDCDLAVVGPLWRVGALARRLPAVARDLERRLGVPVSLNPIPTIRLRRSRHSLYVWKVRSEAVVLAAPRGFSLDRRGSPTVSAFAAASYVFCAVLGVLEAFQPSDRRRGSSTPELGHAIRRAVLHLAQLRLLDLGGYASTLDAALRDAGDDLLAALARDSERTEALGRLCVLLKDEARRRPLVVPRWKVPARNAQYVVVAALHGRSRWRAALTLQPVEGVLASSMVQLLDALDDPGAPDAAAVTLPRGIAATAPATWRDARDLIATEWRDAHPLAGLFG
jgi:predicted nucleotidyltransferase